MTSPVASPSASLEPYASPKVILAVALAAGSFMRLFRLGGSELSGDEVASWVSATAPTLGRVIALQHELNAGKLALYDFTLRGWIGLCGDSEAALRSLSALLGIATVALVFLAARELMNAARYSGDPDFVAATSALITALSPLMVRESREARMYALMLTLVLAQLMFFFRAERRGRLANYVAVAVFTALAIAANFTALAVVGVEGLWILYRASQSGRALGDPEAPPAWRMGAAMLAGFAILAPFTAGFEAGVHGARRGDFSWIAPSGPFEPIHIFEAATGTLVFPLLAALSAWAVLRLWRAAPYAVRFALLWMWLPPIALLAGSYLFTPMLVTRYVLSSFVAFFILSALGIDCIQPRQLALAALIVVAVISTARVGSYYRKAHDTQWREAASFAISQPEAGDAIGVVDYDNDGYVVGYYLRYLPIHPRIVRIAAEAGSLGPMAPRVAIVPLYLPSNWISRFEHAYPRKLADFRGVEVLAR